MNSRIYQQRAAAEQLVARLEADDRYSDVVLDQREVMTDWHPITARTPTREPWALRRTPEPIDAAVNVW